jgi:Ser/Thr protein kinase RdoA (MazF antagonist)
LDNFYTLDSEAQAGKMTALAVKALKRWDGVFTDVSLIKYRENAVFSVWNDQGQRFALRIHRFAYHSNAELLSELHWMDTLRSAGIGAPPVIPASDGSLFVEVEATGVPEPRQVDMLGWIDGSPLGSIEGNRFSDGTRMAQVYHKIGTLSGRLHNHSSKWNVPEGFSRHAWDTEGLLGDQPFWGCFLDHPALDGSMRELIVEACAKARADLHQFGSHSQNYGMIHADFVPENLIVDGNDIVLIDFDDAGFGWYLFELATALYFYLDDPSYPEIRDALLAGYRSVRPLSDAEWGHLPLFLFLRSLTYVGWVHTRHETETAREMAPMFIERTLQLARVYLT